MVTGSFLENYLEATSSSKTNVLSVGKGLFSVFCKFLSDEVETISWESEPNRSKLFGQRNLLIKWFWRYLDLKNGLCEHFKRFFFSVICKFLSDEVGTIFWESEAKCLRLFKSKFERSKVLRKWFWSCLQLKNVCCEGFKRALFCFLRIFEWRSWNHFLGKWGKVLKTI